MCILIPDNIQWTNLQRASSTIKLLKVCLILVNIFIVFAIGTPQHVAVHADEFGKEIGISGATATSVFASIVMWSFAILMPLFATLSCRLVGYYTKSQEDINVICSTFSFMVYLILLMPVRF